MKTIFYTLLLFLPMATLAQTGAVNVSSFGAFGDNGLDEGQKIQDALNGAYGRVELTAGKVYYSSIQLKVPDGKTFFGNGATIKPYASLPYNSSFFITTPTATTHSATGQSITVTEGSSTFTYSGASNLTPGEIVTLQNTTTPYWSASTSEPYYYGWYSVVQSVSGTTVTLQHPAPASFSANVIYEYKTGKNIHIKNMVVDMSGRTDGFGMQLNNATGSSIENVTMIGNVPGRSNSLQIGINVQGVNNLVSHCQSFGMKTGIPGYGFAATGANITFQYCSGYANRHSFASAGRNYISTQINFLYDTASNVGVTAGAETFDWHANAWHSRAEGCVTTIGGLTNGGFQLRGRYDTAQYNTVYINNSGTTYNYAFLGFENPYYSIVRFNTINVAGTGGNNRYIGSGKVFGTPVGFQFTDNIISTATSSAQPWMYLNNNTTNGSIVVPVDTTSVVTEPPPVVVSDSCDCWQLVRFK